MTLAFFRSLLWVAWLCAATASAVGLPEDLGRDDGRTRGDPHAPVTLIEYSDFTCGYCLKFFRETWPRLSAKYVDTGKVRFIYRDYPRADRGLGYDTAVAARCAGEQGRYWPMHDQLFTNSGQYASGDFPAYARALSLDVPAFTACLQRGTHKDAIFRDRAEATGMGFRGTPGFLLLPTAPSGKERPIGIPGAFPFEVFEEQIDLMLAAVTPKEGG
jgi:protein-disulfide isomerase